MTSHKDLANLIARNTPHDGLFETPLAGVKLIRWSTPSEPMPVIYEPTVCIVGQGRKLASVGGVNYLYDHTRYLVASLEQPVMGSVVEASREKPYLCLQVDLDRKEIVELATLYPPRLDHVVPAAGLGLYDTSVELLEAAIRLLMLLEKKADLAAIGPLVLREIYYRLLTGPSGMSLRRMGYAKTQFNQIAKAVAWIRECYRGPCRIEQALEIAGMSRSNFHRHFREVTSLTPLEFRTQLRMQEARRLMLAEGVDAATAGFQVGYNSPSHFNRDYNRVFGASPGRDIDRLRSSDSFFRMHSSPPKTEIQ